MNPTNPTNPEPIFSLSADIFFPTDVVLLPLESNNKALTESQLLSY